MIILKESGIMIYTTDYPNLNSNMIILKVESFYVSTPNEHI